MISVTKLEVTKVINNKIFRKISVSIKHIDISKMIRINLSFSLLRNSLIKIIKLIILLNRIKIIQKQYKINFNIIIIILIMMNQCHL